jgi:asparagine N-glycosylation enzyme membrane subunit Stt3
MPIETCNDIALDWGKCYVPIVGYWDNGMRTQWGFHGMETWYEYRAIKLGVNYKDPRPIDGTKPWILIEG